MTKKIGLFGGTFDPIHLGHLNLAREIQQKHSLDEIWFIPAHINPHKNAFIPPASSQDRVAMLKLALEDEPTFFIKDFEVRRPSPSYTIETLRHFLKESPQNHYYLIMGQDTSLGFSRWKDPEEIVKLVSLLIGSRRTNPIQSENKDFKEIIQKGLTETSLMDISSTQIRQFLSEGKDCSELVPKKVLKYIEQHHLYSHSPHSLP